jgi:hypothetical protein
MAETITAGEDSMIQLNRADYNFVTSVISRQTDTWSVEWGSKCAKWYLKLRDLQEVGGMYSVPAGADEFLAFLTEVYPRTTFSDQEGFRRVIVSIEQKQNLGNKYSSRCKPQGALGRVLKWLE